MTKTKLTERIREGCYLSVDPMMTNRLIVCGVIPRNAKVSHRNLETDRIYLTERQVEKASCVLADALGYSDGECGGPHAEWVRGSEVADLDDIFRQTVCIIECNEVDRELFAAAH